jgi:hypothetical protein
MTPYFKKTLPCVISSCSVASLIILAVIVRPAPTLAQQTEVLPPAESIPPHSKDNGFTETPALQPPPAAQPSGGLVKPLRVPDPDSLREWKQLIQQVPGAVPSKQYVPPAD